MPERVLGVGVGGGRAGEKAWPFLQGGESSGGRNLDEVTQRNCMECARAQELRTMGQRLGELGMFQQNR